MDGLKREVPGTPFVPAEGPELHRRCAEIFGIQCAGLAKRIEQLPPSTPLNLGISGGLDSTLALLVAVTTCDMLGLDRRLDPRPHHARLRHHPADPDQCPGTDGTPGRLRRDDRHQRSWHSRHSRRWATRRSGSTAGASTSSRFRAALARVPREACSDLTFENVQARLRTFLLMSKGFVVGTGDLSELALGWSTYNGDHMSMYNPNCSIPKTLVKFLVRYVALHQFPEGAGPANAAVDRRDDDLAGALAGRRGRRDRAIDRGDARALTSCTTSSSITRSAAGIRPRRSCS